MVDTVNITRQMERNAHHGISDFYLVEEKDGMLDFASTMDLERVLEIVKPLPQLPDRDLTNYVKWWNSII